MLIAAGAAAAASATTEEGMRVLESRLSRAPHERGLALTRSPGVSAGKVGGSESWVARQGSATGEAWARSFLFKVTDTAARGGRMPVVEGEVEFWHEADTAVEVWLDTADGPRRVARGWGNKKAWQTLRFRVDDAFLGGRSHEGKPAKLPLDGHDLRVNAWAGDFHVRRATLRAYSPGAYVNWPEQLTVGAVTTPDGARHAAPGGRLELRAALRNVAPKDLTAPARIVVRDSRDRVALETSGEARVAAGGEGAISFAWDTAQAAPGVYDVGVELEAPGANGEPVTVRATGAFVLAGERDIFLVLEREPFGRGIELVRKQVEPVRVESRGRKVDAWAARAGSSELAWGRALRFNVTDPRYRAGAMPSLDLDLSFRQPANTGIRVFMDTDGGPREIASAWGWSPNFKRAGASVNDAHLGARKHDAKMKETLDGLDLRINSYDQDLAIRHVFIRGHARSGPELDWRRMLVFEDVTAAGRPVFAFARGAGDVLRHHLWNNALERVSLNEIFELRDWDGRVLDRRTSRFALGAGVRQTSEYRLDTTGRPNGIYRLEWTLRREGASEGEAPLITRTTNLAIAGVTELPKARDGDFLYGLDVQLGRIDRNPRLLEWTRFMGADIVRGLGQGASAANPGRVRDTLKVFADYGLRAMFLEVPPAYDADAGKRKAANEKLARQLEEMAREQRGRITYYELGNEPDLTFFYPGPMSGYIESYEAMARAIKRGNPDAVVMNGGLCFFGAEGNRRAREFVQKVDPTTIDAWAYHAHGPGVASEREGLERMRRTAREFGKEEGKLFIGTESGVAARTDEQQWMQARTVVQKMVYAQSEAMPLFFYFRLYMTGGDGPYTMLEDHKQPRPSVLAYHTMVGALRGLRFREKVDLGANGAEAYLFASIDGARHALVAWHNRDASVTRNLELGPRGAVAKVRRVDLMGNASAAQLLEDNVAATEIGADPVFLLWESSGPLSPVTVRPSLLETPRIHQVASGGESTLTVRVRAPAAGELRGELAARPTREGGLAPRPANQPVVVAAGAVAEYLVTVAADAPTSDPVWPAEWSVFLDVEPEAAMSAAARDAAPPANLRGRDGAAVRPRVVIAREQRLDFGSAAGGRTRERATALAVAVLRSDREQTIEVGASADWWMAAHVNGERVYSTLEGGNGAGQTLGAHRFPVRLRVGENRVAFVVQAGSQGWSLLSGGPAELRLAAGGAPEGVELELRADGRVLGRETVRVQRAPAPTPWTRGVDALTPTALSGVAQAGEFAPAQVRNRFEAHPDGSRWYGGADDLSGRIWLLENDTHALLVVAARDDRHVPAKDESSRAEADALELSLASSDGRLLSTLAVTEEGGRALVTRQNSRVDAEARVERLLEPGLTVYRVSLPREALAEGFRLNLRLRDNDGYGLKQRMGWRDGWTEDDQQPDGWYQWPARR